TRRIDVGYGGVELEYVHDAFRLVHWSAMLHLGAGAVSYRDDAGGMDLGDGDAFFIAEPGAAVVLNVTEFFRL
ncbi:MAG: hypothetical protein GWN71_27585, partial [Gammaproteobacteria bacterium]|nr:hypothetical protein [Gemmatimonadota bacterium]NIU77175.1 hypothetical protein [Gammaproteobacteria bacterium]